MKKKLKELRDWFLNVFFDIKKIFCMVFESIGNFFKKIWNGIIDFFAWSINRIIDLLQPFIWAWNKIRGAFGGKEISLGYVGFEKAKSELTDINKLKNEIEKEREIMLKYNEALYRESIQPNIDKILEEQKRLEEEKISKPEVPNIVNNNINIEGNLLKEDELNSMIDNALSNNLNNKTSL